MITLNPDYTKMNLKEYIEYTYCKECPCYKFCVENKCKCSIYNVLRKPSFVGPQPIESLPNTKHQDKNLPQGLYNDIVVRLREMKSVGVYSNTEIKTIEEYLNM